jgi:hypothetical protein
MFLAHCETCGRRELRGTRSIDALVNTHHGIELHYTCRVCGAPGVADRPVREPVEAHPLPAVA